MTTRRLGARLLMYHGTCTGPDGEILRSILKEGLKPDPPKKAYESPYPEDENDFYEMDLEDETTMRLDESLGGAYFTTNIEEAKRYATHACQQHAGNPVLISAQIETRSPEVRIDEDFLINYVWEYVTQGFEPESDETHYRDMFDWLESQEPDWQKLARGWIEQQFPHTKISEHRWQQILPAAGEMLQDISVVTFLQNYSRDAYDEAYQAGDDWEVDEFYEIQERVESYKENIGFVTDKLTEITDPPQHGMHNIRILKPVGYRGANRINAVISWRAGWMVPKPGEYQQLGEVAYARSEQDAKFLMSSVMVPNSKWTWHDRVIYDNPVEEKSAAVILGGKVYHQAQPVTFKGAPSGRLIGYKVMEWDPDTGEVVSGADSRVRLSLSKGDVHRMPGKGIFLAADPQYVLDYYAGHEHNVLITYLFDLEDVTSGSLTDREPEISVSEATVDNFKFYDEDLNKLHVGSFRQAADPQRDREYRHQALEAWNKVLDYVRDYRATPYYGKFLVWFERFAPEYKWLLLAIGPKRSDGVKGSFGEAHFPRAEYAIELHVLDEDFWEYDEERQQEELVWELNHADVRSTFVHEFIHYLDRKRRGSPELSKRELEQRVKRKTDPVEYFSNPEEFNAWYQVLAGDVDTQLERIPEHTAQDKLSSFQEFQEFVARVSRQGHDWDLDKLKPKWQRKLTKRLYGLWQDLREKYL